MKTRQTKSSRCLHPVCSALVFIAEISPGQFRVLTDAGWCDADRKQTKKIIAAWRKKHKL